jgi:hypothetical protein
MEKDIVILLAGVVVGVMNAIAGGGMLIGFPVLVALGVPPLAANVTANIITPPGMIVAVSQYRDYLKKVPWRYAYLLIPVVIGSIAGALALRHTSSEHFAELVPWLVLFGIVLFAFQPIIHIRLHNHMHFKQTGLWPLFYISLGILPVSFYGGYFGAGFGFMMLAFLGLGKVHEIHMLNAMKNIAGVVIGLLCLVILHSTGLINWHVGIVMAIGTSAGGYLGANLAKKVPSRWLRFVIIAIGLAAVVYLVIKKY